MTETDWGNLIRISKSELQSEFNEKNKVLHARITDTVRRLEKATETIVSVGNNMASLRAEMKAEISHRPDEGQVAVMVRDEIANCRNMFCEDRTGRISVPQNSVPSHQNVPDNSMVQQAGIERLLGSLVFKIIAGGAGSVGIWELVKVLIEKF